MRTKRPHRRRNPSREVSGVWPIGSLLRDALPENDTAGDASPATGLLARLQMQLDARARQVSPRLVLEARHWSMDGAWDGPVWVFPSGDWFVWLPGAKNAAAARQSGLLLRRMLRPAAGLPPELARLHRGTLWVGHPSRIATDQAGGGAIPVAGGLVAVGRQRGPRLNPRESIMPARRSLAQVREAGRRMQARAMAAMSTVKPAAGHAAELRRCRATSRIIGQMMAFWKEIAPLPAAARTRIAAAFNQGRMAGAEEALVRSGRASGLSPKQAHEMFRTMLAGICRGR
jgi:hypothetical protein